MPRNKNEELHPKFINIAGITGGRQAGQAVQGATDQLPVHRSVAQRQEGVPLFL